MSKPTRKRRHASPDNAPKPKFRPYDDDARTEEEQLSHILFGGAPSFLKSLEEAEHEAATTVDSGLGEEDSSDSEPPAVWNDDDDGIEVGEALSCQQRKLPAGGANEPSNSYEKLLRRKFSGKPEWAKRKREYDSDDETLRKVGFLRQKTAKKSLPAGLLELKKVCDLNGETYSEGPFINVVEFHPTSRVGLVAGQSGIATLYAVEAKPNKLHSILFQKFPIFCGKFINHGNEALLGSRFNYIYKYDLLAAKPMKIPLPHGLTQCKKFTASSDLKTIAVIGKWGEIHGLTTNCERIFTLKQNSNVTGLAYNKNGNSLFSHGDTGEVSIFDMRMHKVMAKFTDDGCLQGTSIAVSSSNQFLATGSAQGVVNLYNMEDVFKSRTPKPYKTIMNLTTSITDMCFNSTSELLAFSSIDIPNAVKLFHLGDGSVFSNFPGFQTKLGHGNIVNFSPNSGFFTVGNRKSIVSMFSLKYYHNY